MSKTRTSLNSWCKPPPHLTVKQSVMLSSSSIFPQLEMSSWEGGPHGAGCFMNNVLASVCLLLGWESAGLLCAWDGRFWTFSTKLLDGRSWSHETHPASFICVPINWALKAPWWTINCLCLTLSANKGTK